MSDWNERPKECRAECRQQKCVGSGCRFLHDEAADHSDGADHVADAGKVMPYEKKEGRHVRRET